MHPFMVGARIATESTLPLVLGSHHKSGTHFLQLLCKFGRPILERKGLTNVVSGNAWEKRFPLSAILANYVGVQCYQNLWFEHEIDVPRDSIRLLHFVRHPVSWIRSAYLYHKQGAPNEQMRWVDWKIFRLKGRSLSYTELLNTLDTTLGLMVEAVRSLPEIAATARVASTSDGLTHRLQISLDELYENYEATVAKVCAFVEFDAADTQQFMAALQAHDISKAGSNNMPAGVTRNSNQAGALERTLAQDSALALLYRQPAQQMGFQFPDDQCVGSALPHQLIQTLIQGQSHLLANCASVMNTQQFLKTADAPLWWTTYPLQAFSCGHLAMYNFMHEVMQVA